MPPAPLDTTEHPPGKALGVVTVLLTLAGWCAIPIFLRHFADQIDPWTANGWRYGFAALIWLPVIVFGLRRRTLPADLWKRAAIPAAINSIGQVCFTYAHYKIDPGLLTFGLRMQVVFVTIGAVILFPAERRIVGSPAYLVGLTLVLAGTLLTVALDEGFGTTATTAGILLAISAGALFACYGLSVRHFMQRVPSLTAFAAISQLTAIAQLALMLPLARDFGVEPVTEMVPTQFALLLLSAVIGIAMGHVFYYISIKRLGVTVSTGVIQLQPFGVGVASYFLFDERLSPTQWAAGFTAVFGAGLILWTQHRMTRRPPAPRPEPGSPATASDPPLAPLGRTRE